jgi:MFS family permease
MTTLLAMLTDIAPQVARGGAVGLYRTFMDVGGFLGPIVFMIVYDNYSPLTPFYVAAGLCVLNILLTFFARTKSSTST